ncbi:GNAT family N-acetyltransferase [Cupriavidus plantarum]|uniref:GNAT family N-acetyltransferase n=1 Tax=Cupriavidus plantarum TaxID=942865 RepID=UPI00339D9964
MSTDFTPIHGFRAFEASGRPLLVSADGEQLTVRARGAAEAEASFALIRTGTPVLRLASTTLDGDALTNATLAALEAVTTCWRVPAAGLDIEHPATLDALTQMGLAEPARGLPHAQRQCRAEMLWQHAPLWMPAKPPYPLRYTMTGEKRHPVRPPKPNGTVYARYIPWLGRTLTLRAATVQGDTPLLHRWMNDPDVAYFWQEEGDEDKHRRYLQGLVDDPHMLPLVVGLDDSPFGYFEIYWARENRLAPFYDAHDHDRGWHVLIGEPAFRGKSFLTAWFPAIQHYQFLDDPRTQRIVGEPRADHHRQIANLDKAGFSKVKEFDFPHKRAMLVMLLRERFFGEGLYLPHTEANTA